MNNKYGQSLPVKLVAQRLGRPRDGGDGNPMPTLCIVSVESLVTWQDEHGFSAQSVPRRHIDKHCANGHVFCIPVRYTNHRHEVCRRPGRRCVFAISALLMLRGCIDVVLVTD